MKKTAYRRLNSIMLAFMLIFLQFSGLGFRTEQNVIVRAAEIGTGKKVLFDNAHAQVAGSANWRITTDFKAFADDLKRLGYAVTENNSKFSDSVLANIDVLVIPEANSPFTIEEKQALIRFVESGKGIYFISDHTGSDRNNDGWDSTEIFNGYQDGQTRTSENELLNKFGFECLKNTVWQSPITDIRESWVSPKGDFTKGIGAWAGCTFKITDPAKAQAVAILTPNGPTDSTPDFQKWLTNEKGGEAEGSYVVVAKPNKGKVAAIGDSSPVEENSKYHGWTDSRYEDAKISLNIVNWLATPDDSVGIPQSRQTPNVGNAAGSGNTGGTTPSQTLPYKWNNVIPEKKPAQGAKNNGKLVLFDNSHQNTAGQADWVIDGGFSDFADALVKEGYTVREYRGIDKDGDGAIRLFDDRKLKLEEEGTVTDKNEAIITYDAIKDADVFITAESNRPLRKSEQNALKQFVDSGKGVYFIADHYNADRNCNTWDSDEVYNGYNRYDGTDCNIGGVYGDLRNPKDGSKGWLAENFGVRFRFNAIDLKTGASGIKPESEAEGVTKGVKPVLMAAGSTLAIVDTIKAKGIVYFSSTDKPTKWGSAVDKGVYFGGEAEGPFVAISKPSKGRAAFLGDSSPVEDASPKYKNENGGTTKALHAGWTSAGNAAQLSINVVNWLADSSIDYVGFGSPEHPKGIATSTLMAVEEMTDPDAGKPWSTPGYDAWNTDTYAAGSYGAPYGSSGGSTGGGGTTTPPSGTPTIVLAPMYIYGSEPFGVIIGGNCTDTELGIYKKTGGIQVGVVKQGDTWLTAGTSGYTKISSTAVTAKAKSLDTNNLMAIKVRSAGFTSKSEKRDVTSMYSDYGFISGIVPGDAGDVVAVLDGEDVIGTAQVEAGGNVRMASRTGEGYNLVLYGKDGSVKAELQGEYSVKAGETTNIISKVDVASVILDASSKELKVGESFGLTAAVLPENATNKNVKWSSNKNDVAEVDSQGKVTAKAPGEAIITVTTEDAAKTAECTVKVIQPVTGINLDKQTAKLKIGGTIQLNAEVSPSNASNKKVIWNSSNKAVASVADGKVTALALGKTTIEVKTEDGSFTASCEIEVVDSSMSVTFTSLEDENKLNIVVNNFEVINDVVTVKIVDRITGDICGLEQEILKDGNANLSIQLAPGSYTAYVKGLSGESREQQFILNYNPASEVQINKSTLNLKTGEFENLTVEVKASNNLNATYQNVSWASSNTDVAEIDMDGKVTAVGPGETTITVVSLDGKKTSTCRIIVTQPVTGVSLDKTSVDLKAGESITLKAAITPENASNKAVTWSSDKESVATVDASGKVTAIAPGEATITVTSADGNKTAVCKVVVTQPVIGITLDKASADLKVGETTTLIATITPENASNKAVTWSSDKESVATVDASGKVVAVGPGEATITVTSVDGNKTASCKVIVTQPVLSVTLDKQNLDLNVGESSNLIAKINPDNASNKALKWTSSKENVAKVDADGKVIAVGVGITTITVTTVDGNKTDSCVVNVSSKVVPVESISLEPTIAELKVGKKLVLKAVISPKNASNKGIIWSSDNEAVAIVDFKGHVTAIGAGEAIITATTIDGEFKASCRVKVVKTVEIPNNTTEIINSIKDNQVKEIKVNVTDNTIIDKSIFETLKAEADNGNNKVITFEVKTNKVEMTWTFEGKDIKDTANIKSIDLSIKGTSSNAKEVVSNIDKNALILSFAPNGVLPAPATVRLKVPSYMDASKDIFCYYFNSDTKALIEKQGPLTAIDGYVTVTINHCSEYVLTGVNLDNNNGNNSNNGGATNPSDNGSNNNQGTNGGNTNSNNNNTQAQIPKTGSPVDMTSLVLLGALIISAGVFLIIKKTKKT